jgi:hypothetical protein
MCHICYINGTSGKFSGKLCINLAEANKDADQVLNINITQQQIDYEGRGPGPEAWQ